jgi:hypothetical protein
MVRVPCQAEGGVYIVNAPDMILVFNICLPVPLGLQPCRFRLGNPSADYERVYTNVQRKFDLCVRAATVISTMGDATLQQALPIITRPVHNVGGRGVYNMADIRAEAGFLAGQLSAYGMVSGVQVVCSCGVDSG